MKLHIFNPEHDIALASNLANFTAPHAGRQLRENLGFLPALWAADGDAVLVDDVASAERLWNVTDKKLKNVTIKQLKNRSQKEVTFITGKQPMDFREVTAVDVWGWDRALKASLQRKGVDASLLPSDDYIERVRQLSHRRTAAQLLPRLRQEGTVGEAFECSTIDDVNLLLNNHGHVVVKAPWSSSGRGVRFVEADNLQPNFGSWLHNLLLRQGSVMVEPYYHKVKDFAMEFSADGKGHIRYEGLSLFHTANGAYVGNILATEQTKRDMLSRYVSLSLIDSICETIVDYLDLEDYCGPLGIDMMVVRENDRLLLHPCVEINLRRTMGHVALTLSPVDDGICRVMRITYSNTYKLSLRKLHHSLT